MKRFLVILLLFSRLAYADLDDTMQESVFKYGPASATGSAQILTYRTNRFRIWETFDATGHCVIAEYSPLNGRPLPPEDCAELDRKNLPGLTPGVGAGWETVAWPDNSRDRDTVSFQYTKGDTLYQVITGQSRDAHGWYFSRLYLNTTGIQIFKSF